MTAPRHGTPAGYTIGGCRKDCCSIPKARADKLRSIRAENGPLTMPVIGIRRRIQALRAICWTNQHIADAAGYKSYGALGAMLYNPNRKRVTIATYQRIVAAYDVLSVKRGPSDETRRRAIANGWPPPLLWEGVNIDDPDAQPVHDEPGADMTASERLDDWLWLVRSGEELSRAANRVGYRARDPLDTIRTVARRHGRDDVIAVLDRAAAERAMAREHVIPMPDRRRRRSAA